ncbi:MAG: site-2 protease family protein, partial [Candidatus Tectomicrobia bacterium]|nr:site-2 protease family protein [Candidatus Tectomicrobia bacterium]
MAGTDGRWDATTAKGLAMSFPGIPSGERHVNGTLKPESWGPLPLEMSSPLVRQYPAPQVASRGPTRTHVLLFVATIITTLLAGMSWSGIKAPLQHLDLFYRGIPYAGTLLAILFCHEMGHYLTARYYGVQVTPPYFLPSPPFIMGVPFLGTFGAVIRMQSPPQHRCALLNIGAAGPIAGFCVALPAMLYALTTATQVPITALQDGSSYAQLASPLLLHLMEYWLIGPTPSGMVLTINSMGVAAWFGLLVTVLNLLPIGQLDGGHILFALLGPRARYISWVVMGALLVLGVLAWPGWI